jgi:GT2 family glycosyltransferase
MDKKIDSRPLVSVVVCTYQRPLFLKKCLESLLSNTYRHYEIIIVGQGADHTSQVVVADHFKNHPKMRCVHTETVGLSPARNTGCDDARGDVIAFIDDDAVASPEWMEGYVEAFQQVEPTPGMVGGRIEPLWEKQRPGWYPAEREFLLGLYNIGDTIRPFPDTDLPVGANFAVLRSVVRRLGGFDERLGFNTDRKHSMIAGEDSLYALRIKEAGYPICYQPKSKVYHHISSAKLTRKYFLKRHFWEGVTHVAVEFYRGSSTRNRLRGHLFWNFKKTLATGVILPRIYLSNHESKASQMMLKLSEMACSLGACVKSLELIVKNKTN